VNEWISVKDKNPPDNGEDWLVLVKNKNKPDGIFLYDVAQYECGEWNKSNTWEDVTHWMPLPAPPEK